MRGEVERTLDDHNQPITPRSGWRPFCCSQPTRSTAWREWLADDC